MRRILVNADDFGLTEGVCRGILDAMRAGIVGATTAMVCAEGGLERIRRLGPGLAGRLGLHLQLTGGRPCLPPTVVPSLVTAAGAFPRKKKDVQAVDPAEVDREWRAQLARFRSLGFSPSHLDSHHHIHKRPELFPVFLELARESGVPARALSDAMRQDMDAAGVPHAALCLTDFYGDGLSPQRFCALLDDAFSSLGGSGVIEVMVHPGVCDAALTAISTYHAGRARELAVLTDPQLAAMLAARAIECRGPDVLSSPGAAGGGETGGTVVSGRTGVR